MGESEKLVSNLFQMARESAPSIIFIDEIDSLCGQRGEGNESEASRRVKTEFLVQMQGVGNSNQRVLVLAATNTPYALDQAIRRRFDKRIYIPLPDLKARQHMFKVHLGDTPHSLTESDFEHLAHKTQGFSGSDISVCVNEVLFEPIRKTKDATFFMRDSNKMWVPCAPNQRGAIRITMQELETQGFASKVLPPPLTRIDFDKVLSRQKPTVSKADLEVHERFTKEFGEKADSSELEDLGICNRYTMAYGSELEDLDTCNRYTMELAEESSGLEDLEICKTHAMEFGENSSCLSGSEDVEGITKEIGETNHRNSKLIMNVGIAICVLISSIPLFLR